MPKNQPNNDLYDVYYDVSVTLFDRICKLMDEQSEDMSALKMIRDHVVRAVAKMKNVTPASVYRELEDVRTEPSC